MELPKVLIVGQSFNSDTGGGITLTNLFKGWDRAKIAVTCSPYLLLDNIDTDVCNTYYQLGHKEHSWLFPFSLFKRKYRSGQVKFGKKKIHNLTIPKSQARVSFIMNVFLPFIEFIGLNNLLHKTVLSKELRTWMDDFKPDVIYSQATSHDNILFCLAIESYLQKPLIYHVMDDWPSTISQIGPFKNYWHNRIDKELRNLMNKATVLMSISEEMSLEYKARYDKDFVPFHNTIDVDFWNKFQRKSYELTESPTLLYAGRIGLGIDSSLETVAKAIGVLNEDLNMSFKLVLQTQDKPLWIKKYKHVVHSSFVAYSDLPKVFSASDMLLLPYDFSIGGLKYIKYSMPTKAPEYMITGTPVVVFAPEDTALVKYAQKYNWAKVITENKEEKVVEALKQMILNKDLRQQYAQNAIKLAEENHNSVLVSSQFKEAIVSATTK